MNKLVDKQINELVTTLSRIREEHDGLYEERVKKYLDMVDGGDGGPWREGADMSLRDLHYKNWTNENFQDTLELLKEVPVMSPEDRDIKFKEERSVWSKLKKVFGG